jgi:hypothetical protein
LALIGNYTLLNRTSIRTFAGTATSMTAFNYSPPASLKNRLSKYGQISGTPYGYLAPVSWVLPNVGGAMSFYADPLTMIAVSADAKMGRSLVGSSSLVLTLTNAQADQIVALIGSASLTLATADAGLSAGVEAVASGSMAIIADASLGGIIPVEALAACSISADVDLSALAFMEAEAGGATPLSPEGLTAELLDNQDIETGYSLREALRLVLSSVAGKVSGAETTTITFRNIVDDKDRIVATVDSNGNRTSITYDVSES